MHSLFQITTRRSLRCSFVGRRPGWKTRYAVCVVLAGVSVLAYCLSVFWRVSIAEELCFGRSNLFNKVSSHSRPEFDEPAVSGSFGSKTFSYERNGLTVHVHYHLINGFQHTFGSALTAFEVGSALSDFGFRVNEYRDAYLSSYGSTLDHWLDTKKDLANNIVGREIGRKARLLHLNGRAAEKYMIDESLKALEDGRAIAHPRNPKVSRLPGLDDFGCPLLPNPAIASESRLKQM